MKSKSLKNDVRKITLGGVLIAITLVLGFTGWGFIPLPLPIAGATIFHIPVVLAGILFGLDMALICGLIFGLFATFTFPVFPWFVMIPGRLFIGVTAYFVFIGMMKLYKAPIAVSNLIMAATLAGVLGSLTNSVLTLGLGVVFRVFGPELSANMAVVFSAIPVVVIEAVIAAILCSAIVVALHPLGYIETISQNTKKAEL
ncbi:MAG: ECF transporter S component [Caldisericia bacterium]|nr:ECF transporter S component [Caldisericia bacterium]